MDEHRVEEAEGSEGRATEEESAEFDFSGAERLIDSGEVKPSDSGHEEALEGELLSAQEKAKLQARSVVGLMDITFKLKDSEHDYPEEVYRDAEKHVAPAILRLNINIPAFEVVNAITWLVGTALQSIRAIRKRKPKKDAKQEHQPTQ